MKLKNLFYLTAIVIMFGLGFSSCSQATNKTAASDETEMSMDKGDETAKCGDGSETTDSTAKCGEGKCGDAKEASDTTKKCGEGKCGA